MGPTEYHCVNYKRHLACVFRIHNSGSYFDEISYSVEGSFTSYITEVLKFTDERHTMHTALIGELSNAHNILGGISKCNSRLVQPKPVRGLWHVRELTPLKIIPICAKTHTTLIQPMDPQDQEFLRLQLAQLHHHRGLEVFVLPDLRSYVV